MRWFDPAGWVKLAEEHRAQGSALVPSMIQMLLGQPLEEADLSELTAISSGASPLPEEVLREFEARVPSATIYEGYGCTESATLISANPFGARRVGSVGLPVAGCEVSIQDDSGAKLPAGQDGEICVRSPGVMSGYWHSPDSAATVLAGGWLHTGDIGHLDADGYLYVVDRKKDLILRGGFNVFPRDVEDALVAHPAVALAGVVGRPDVRLGEEVVAFVSLRPGASATVEELTEHARQAPGGEQVPAADHDRADHSADQRGQARPQETPTMGRGRLRTAQDSIDNKSDWNTRVIRETRGLACPRSASWASAAGSSVPYQWSGAVMIGGMGTSADAGDAPPGRDTRLTCLSRPVRARSVPRPCA